MSCDSRLRRFIYLLVPVCLVLLDCSLIRPVDGQLDAMGAVLSVVPMGSIITTAGLVGLKLAALSRLLQVLGYDQAYLANGGAGTAAEPIGLQTEYSYILPYVPGLNISVKGEHGASHQNNRLSGGQKEVLSGPHTAVTRKTYPAMGLPGDYENQRRPFRGSDTLREIFRNAGVKMAQFPTQNQIEQQQLVNLKGNSQFKHVEGPQAAHPSENLVNQPSVALKPPYGGSVISSNNNYHHQSSLDTIEHKPTSPIPQQSSNIMNDAAIGASMSLPPPSLSSFGPPPSQPQQPATPNPTPVQPVTDPQANLPPTSSGSQAPVQPGPPQAQTPPNPHFRHPQTHILSQNSQVSSVNNQPPLRPSSGFSEAPASVQPVPAGSAAPPNDPSSQVSQRPQQPVFRPAPAHAARPAFPFHPVPQHQYFFNRLMETRLDRKPIEGLIETTPPLASGQLTRLPESQPASPQSRPPATFEDYDRILFGSNGAASDTATNFAPLPFVLNENSPPFHDDLEQNEFTRTMHGRRRRKRRAIPDLGPSSAPEAPASGPSLAREFMQGQQESKTAQSQHQRQNFGMPAVNIHPFRKKRSLG